jgi:hypothetical protein
MTTRRELLQTKRLGLNGLWLIALLLLTTGLAARRLNADVIFVDEYWSIFNSGGAPYGPLSPGDLWKRVIDLDPGGMGMLYYYALSGWEAVAGASPFAVRAFSLLIGLLATAMIYRLGRNLFSARIGLYAAAVLGASAFFIDYLHEARAYTMFTLLTAFTVWVYWKLLRSEREPRWWSYALLTLGLVALAYTHYVALVVGVSIGVYHLLFVPKNRRWRRIVGAMILAAVLYLPWLSVTVEVIHRGTGDTNRQATSMNAGTTLETLVHAFSNGSAGLLALVLLYTLTERRRAAGYVWFLLLLSLVVILAVNAVVPFMVHLRYLLGLWGLLALLVGIGIARLGERGLTPVILLAVWMGVGVWQTFQPGFINDLFGQVYRAPWAGLSQGLDILKSQSQPDDLVLFHISQPGYEPFNYFVLDYLMHGIPGRYDQIERMNNSFAKDDNGYLVDVYKTIRGAPFIWTLVVPEIPTTNKSGVVNYVLQTQYAQCQRVLDRPDLQMTLYAKSETGENALYRFGDGIALLPLSALPDSVQNRLRIVQGWVMDAVVPRDAYSVAVHIENAAGQLVAQGDYGLPNQRPFGCEAEDVTLDKLPPGEYHLLVGVYAWQTGQRLPGAAVKTGEKGDRLLLKTFTIQH